MALADTYIRPYKYTGKPSGDKLTDGQGLYRLCPIELPVVLNIPESNLAEQAHAVLQAAAKGDLAPAQCSQVMATLVSVAKIVETADLLSRVVRDRRGRP